MPFLSESIMKINWDKYTRNPEAKAGLTSALAGFLLSFKTHRTSDTPVNKAGKTALFTGIGFFMGTWIGKLLERLVQQKEHDQN